MAIPRGPRSSTLPAMAAAAGATQSIRVMTGIVIVPLYDPVLLAKMVSTVDVVSGGRLDFGIGISGQRGTKVEFDAVGVSVRTRGRRTDEMLRVMKRLWTEEKVAPSRRLFRFRRRYPGSLPGTAAPPSHLGGGQKRGRHAPRRFVRRRLVPVPLHRAPVEVQQRNN